MCGVVRIEGSQQGRAVWQAEGVDDGDWRDEARWRERAVRQPLLVQSAADCRAERSGSARRTSLPQPWRWWRRRELSRAVERESKIKYCTEILRQAKTHACL